MRCRTSVVWACIVAVAACAGATAASAAPITAVGSYTVTYRATNAAAVKPSTWNYRVVGACRIGSCTTLTMRVRLASEARERTTPARMTWDGGAFRRSGRISAASSCAGRRKTVPGGYDVVYREIWRPAAAAAGRVTRFAGRGRDRYVPNAAGRRAGCVRGVYMFAITARAK